MKKKSFLPAVSTLAPSVARRMYLKRELEELGLVIQWHKDTRGEVPQNLAEKYEEMKKEFLAIS